MTEEKVLLQLIKLSRIIQAFTLPLKAQGQRPKSPNDLINTETVPNNDRISRAHISGWSEEESQVFSHLGYSTLMVP